MKKKNTKILSELGIAEEGWIFIVSKGHKHPLIVLDTTLTSLNQPQTISQYIDSIGTTNARIQRVCLNASMSEVQLYGVFW